MNTFMTCPATNFAKHCAAFRIHQLPLFFFNAGLLLCPMSGPHHRSVHLASPCSLNHKCIQKTSSSQYFFQSNAGSSYSFPGLQALHWHPSSSPPCSSSFGSLWLFTRNSVSHRQRCSQWCGVPSGPEILVRTTQLDVLSVLHRYSRDRQLLYQSVGLATRLILYNTQEETKKSKPGHPPNHKFHFIFIMQAGR